MKLYSLFLKYIYFFEFHQILWDKEYFYYDGCEIADSAQFTYYKSQIEAIVHKLRFRVPKRYKHFARFKRKYGYDEYLITDFKINESETVIITLKVLPFLSSYVYCANNPVNLVDPDGEEINPIYDCAGNFISNTKEGFTGEILIYSGNDDIDFSNMTKEGALMNNDIDTYDNQRFNMTNDSKSNIWTHIASQFEGLQVYDEVFSMSSIKDGKIGFGSTGSWNTTMKTGRIRGTDNYRYKSTVENIASSIIVHEWYSHWMKKNGDPMKSHRLAYKNVINFKYFWNKTTDDYKGFNVLQLQSYTKKETGRANVDSPYRYSYRKYKGSYPYGKCYTPKQISIIPNFQTDTAILANNMDSVVIICWNLFGTKYEAYVFSYSLATYTLSVSAAYWNGEKMFIHSANDIHSIIQSINQFYILKSQNIVQKKIPKEEPEAADYPCIFVDVFRSNKKMISKATDLDTDYYHFSFHPDFLSLWDILTKYIRLFDEERTF